MEKTNGIFQPEPDSLHSMQLEQFILDSFTNHYFIVN